MGAITRRRADHAGRLPRRSPGRPPVGRREHRTRFWEAIAHGLSSEDAGVVAGVSPAVGTRWFRDNGGMPSSSLAPLSWRSLSFGERAEIAIVHAQGFGIREIARRIGRCPSTISRELRRNAATRGGDVQYRATTAQWHADRCAKRPNVAKLAANKKLRHSVQDRLAGVITAADGTCVPGPDVCWIGRKRGRRRERRWARSWSPEQMAHRRRVDVPEDDSMRISHEAIYQALYVQGRGALRRDTGESYEAFIGRLAEVSGVETPTRAELARFDRKRPKKGSNDEWTHPQDPDAKITRMKDGRTRLAHKAEHAVDLETGAVVGVTVQDADAGDTKTMSETLITAAEQVEAVLPDGVGITEMVGDKDSPPFCKRHFRMDDCPRFARSAFTSRSAVRGRPCVKPLGARRKAGPRSTGSSALGEPLRCHDVPVPQTRSRRQQVWLEDRLR